MHSGHSLGGLSAGLGGLVPVAPRVVAVGGSGLPAERPSFTLTFDTDESPISYGGIFVRGPSTYENWEAMVASGGLFYGTNGPDDAYDDSFARIEGAIGNYNVEWDVFRSGSLDTGITHEIEINRLVENPDGSVTGIEILFHYGGFCQCFLWDHPNTGANSGTFTEVGSSGGTSSGGIGNGARCRVTFSGTTATCQQWNGTSWDTLAIFTHARFALYEIAPGYFTRPGGNPAHYCMTSLTVTPT